MLLSPPSALGFLVFLIIALPWYVFVIHRFGRAFTHEFFYNDHIRRLFEAEHPQNDNWYFYPGSIVIGMFPWSVFVLTSFVQLVTRLTRRGIQPLYLYFACWLLVMFVFFQPAHSKLVSYIFPVFPAFAIMIGNQLCDWAASRDRRYSISAGVISCATLALIPLGMIFASRFYSMYVPSVPLVNGIIAIFVGLLAIMVVLAARRNLLQSAYVLCVMLPVLFFLALFSCDSIDPYLSSESACRYLLRSHTVGNTILCSKYFSRGVFYFTGNKIAVIDIGGSGFFSPHPIPYLDTKEEVREFLRSQRTTYCIVDRSSLGNLQQIAAERMAFDKESKNEKEHVGRSSLGHPQQIAHERMMLDVERKTGNEYVVRVDSYAEPDTILR